MNRFHRKRCSSPGRNEASDLTAKTAHPSPLKQTPLSHIFSSSLRLSPVPRLAFASPPNQHHDHYKKPKSEHHANRETDGKLTNNRNSIKSIQEDPFFKNYASPQTLSLARELKTASNAGYHENERFLVANPPALKARPATGNLVGELAKPPSTKCAINIAVIGAAGVGKSTLIQRALGLSAPTNSVSTSLPIFIDNVAFMLSLIELGLESLSVNPGQKIDWPNEINGQIVPRIDGALVLCDVQNKESIQNMPEMLNELVVSLLPTILVSCKCDMPEQMQQIDAEAMKHLSNPCFDVMKMASNVPESARLCLSAMIRAIMICREDPNSANQGFSSDLQKTPSRRSLRELKPSEHYGKHSRANSEYLAVSPNIILPFTVPTSSSVSSHSIGPGPRRPWSSRTGQSSLLGQVNFHHNLQFARTAPEISNLNSPSGLPSDISTCLSEEFTTHSDSLIAQITVDENPKSINSDGSFFRKSNGVNSSNRDKPKGVTFDELVDRLTGEVTSTADQKFVDIFLCLYRKFASPGKLFTGILARLELVTNEKKIHTLIRAEKQFRILNIVSKWICAYPGDFAGPSTSRKLCEFIQKLSKEPLFVAAADEIRRQFELRVMEDDDTGWAKTDADFQTKTCSESDSISLLKYGSVARTNSESFAMSFFGDDESEEMDRKFSRAAFQDRLDSPVPSLNGIEDYEREAITMVPRGHLSLNKILFNDFIQISDDDFSTEMTRIDWVMFSCIRLRDLIRHVILSSEQKELCKGLKNVNRMINHFNHIAKWVANMILMRDKAKYRAVVLEKFINIAFKLRQLNNYNGLAAVLAGINGSAIHRLTQTWSLVPIEIQRRFTRLVVLMGTQKSYYAYRIAWENSSSSRIPYIPLHRRDLISAEQGSRTFLGEDKERINWRKFEVLSEIILPIMKSQMVPYPNLTKIKAARELILNCKMLNDDEEVYQRSLAVESHNPSTSVEFGKKKFTWFQK
ncbi:unnamed protein product [Blumeria hordei]|uniref:Ras guanine nucleotide exchange factor n=2 Tax=Blumeria hordei TaxID=2867405 RepID=A0A383UW27_BLUHO|nr:ras guanine nucleotide exchange factor [Blumeria hordei DH14]SZF03969.1 unnamed protein product [Blumeria hordei]